MWIWKISTFSPDLAVTWRFCPNDFSLCPSECMLYECVTMNSLCNFTWGGGRDCPRISKSKQRLSPAELVCNQFDMALTSIYQSAYRVGWNKTLYQMLAKEHAAVFSTSCDHFFCKNLSSSGKFLSVLLREVRGGSFCSRWDLHELAQVFQCLSVMPGFGWYHSPNAVTTLRPNAPRLITTMLRGLD